MNPKPLDVDRSIVHARAVLKRTANEIEALFAVAAVARDVVEVADGKFSDFDDGLDELRDALNALDTSTALRRSA